MNDAQRLKRLVLAGQPSQQAYILDGYELVASNRINHKGEIWFQATCSCDDYGTLNECDHSQMLMRWLMYQSKMTDFGFSKICSFKVDETNFNLICWTFKSLDRNDISCKRVKYQFKQTHVNTFWDDISKAVDAGWRVVLEDLEPEVEVIEESDCDGTRS